MRHIIDSHTHLIDEIYQKEGYDYDYLVNKSLQAGILYIIDTGCTLEHSHKIVQQAMKYKCVWAVVGIHPTEAFKVTDEDLAQLDKLAAHNQVVGIGEIGLDYYWSSKYEKIQKEVFEKQLLIAKKHKYPVILHIRDKKDSIKAYQDAIELLKKHSIKKAMVHCFASNYDVASMFLKQGYYISIPGIVTYKNATELQEAVVKIPLKQLLVETDAPYLTPEPFRGKINRPDRIINTINKIAELKNLDANSIIDVTTKNALKFYDIK